MAKTSAIHEEMVIKANKFKSDWFSGVYGNQGYPGPQGYSIHPDETRRQYVCKEDYSYISVFDVCSVFKDEIYEGVLIGNVPDSYNIYEIGATYGIGIFKKDLFYSRAEMRDIRINEILNEPEGQINKTSHM